MVEKLHGTLIDNRRGKLKGTLIERSREKQIENGHTLSIGTRLVQRDSGDTFEIINFTETRSGTKVKLKCVLGKEMTLTKDKNDLEGALKNKGSEWHWKE